MTPEQAEKKVAQARGRAEGGRDALFSAIADEWQRWANDVVDKCVLGQPQVTRSIETPELTTLKINLVSAINSGVSSVPATFEAALDVDELARRVRHRASGEVRVDLDPGKGKLVRNLHDLLKAAGYSLESFKTGGSYSSSEMLGSNVNLNVYPVLSTFKKNIEDYANAKFELAAAEEEVAAAEAAERWNNLPG